MPDSAPPPLSQPLLGLPGLVLAFHVDGEGRAEELQVERPLSPTPAAGWLWLHFNLADKRACTWIGASAELPAAARALLVALQDHQQLYATNDCIYGVFADLMRTFDATEEDTGYLAFAMAGKLLVSGRRQPLQAVDAVRATLLAGRRVVTPAALIEVIVGEAMSGIEKLIETLAKELDRAEDKLLIDSVEDERRRLGRIRRTGVRLHRQLASLRLLLKRFDVSDADLVLSPAIILNTDRLAQRLDDLDQEVVATQERARLLHDEISARLSEESARNINALAVITALFLPPSLVAGIFGMNTSNLPLTQMPHGSAWAIGLGVGSAAFAYWILRRLGVIRR
ncbi:MAG TPA: CorA family divalent cation transporter [Bauldia sp.]|nr:CorA family divalent cation transporter [Bauldia sp.]